MADASAIVRGMTDCCPECGRPVEDAKGFLNRNKVFCRFCDRTFDRRDTKKSAKCPNCNTWIILDEKVLEYDCPQCKKNLRLYAEGLKESVQILDDMDGIRDDQVIIRSRQNRFSSATEIHAGAGFIPLFVRGSSITVLDPAVRFPFKPDADNADVAGDLFYVRSRIPGLVRCGTPEKIPVSDPEGMSFLLSARAEIALKVSDPVRFFTWTGYSECVFSDLVSGESGNSRLGLDWKVRSSFQEALIQAVEEAHRKTSQDYDRLNRVEVANVLRECLTASLDEIGLICDNVSFADLAMELDGDLLKQRVERVVSWDTEPLKVHEKDHPEYSAAIVLHGEGRIRIRNRMTLRQSAEGQRWAKPGASDSQAQDDLSGEVSRIVHAAFYNILQPMLDDTGIRLSSIERFLSYMQSSIEQHLNNSGALADMGLEISQVSLRLARNGYQPCAALAARESGDSKIATVGEDERLRKYMLSVSLDQIKDESSFRIQQNGIRVQEAETVHGQNKRLEQLTESDKDDVLAQQISEIGRDRQLDEARAQAEQAARAREEAAEAHRKELADREAEHRRQTELMGYDHAYQVWKKQRLLQQEQAEAARADQTDQKNQDIRLVNMDHEAAREDLLADEKAKAAVRGILRDIQESDFDLRQKLDAIAYLQKVTARNDDLDYSRRQEEVKAEIQRLLHSVSIEDAQARQDLLDRAEKAKDERDESRLQAQFARDMELRRMNISYQIELLKQKAEEGARAAEAKEREEQRAGELAKLQACMTHAENLERQATGRSAIQADVEKIRAICDWLKEDSAARAKAAAETHQRLQQDRDLSMENLRQLTEQVQGMKKQQEEMIAANGKEFQKGLQEVRDMLGQAGRDQKMQDMFSEMKREIERIGEKARQIAQAPVQAPAPAPAPAPVVNNYYDQPRPQGYMQTPVVNAYAERRCPVCNVLVPPYATACMNGHRVG